MANNIINWLCVSGDEMLGNKILDKLREEGMDYFLPRPAYLENDDIYNQRGANPPWYDWSKQHWGCKWDIYEVSEPGTGIGIQYLTANAPNDIFIDWLNTTFPTVMFSHDYEEE